MGLKSCSCVQPKYAIISHVHFSFNLSSYLNINTLAIKRYAIVMLDLVSSFEKQTASHVMQL